MFNSFQNPYMPGNQYMDYGAMMRQQPQVQVTRVNGRNGAEAYAIGPNSSAILLDESGTLVWLVTTDGAGYKTVSPYDISPHQTVPAPDFGSLESRIAKLEAIVNDTTNTAAAKRKRDTEPTAD